MDNKQFAAAKQTAQEVARKAGALLKRGAPARSTVLSEEAHDVKLQADLDSEALIKEHLSAAFPFPIIAEESDNSRFADGSPDGPHWIVDPLDGTFNYSRGIPCCCTSIALWENEKPLLGIIYDFFLDEMFVGDTVNSEATLNETLIQATGITTSESAVFGCGFSGQALKSDQGTLLYQQFPSFRKVRMMGSAALGCAFVCNGRFDVYYGHSIKLWDIAAGTALIRAAGGEAFLFTNKQKSFEYHIVGAATKKLGNTLLESGILTGEDPV